MRASIGAPPALAAPACGSGASASARVGRRRGRASPAVLRPRASALRVRTAQVVEDRVRAVEAVAREALLVAQRALRRRAAAMWCLRGDVADARRDRASACLRSLASARARCSRTARGSCRRRSPVALALDDLVEERARLRVAVEAGRLLQEDLQHVACCARRRRRGSRAPAASRCPRRSSRCRARLDALGQHVVVACPASA